ANWAAVVVPALAAKIAGATAVPSSITTEVRSDRAVTEEFLVEGLEERRVVRLGAQDMTMERAANSDWVAGDAPETMAEAWELTAEARARPMVLIIATSPGI